MPFFLPGDWIQRPKSKTSYRVVRIRADGLLLARHPSGQVCVLTRPEKYRKIAPPNPDQQSTER